MVHQFNGSGILAQWPRSRLLTGTAIAIGVIAGAGAQPALAQTEVGVGDGDQIIVTARKRAEDIQSVPETIKAFTSEQIEQIGFTDVSDLQVAITNFQVQETQQPGTAFVNIRGVTMQRFQEPSVAVVVDGVQLTSQYQILQATKDVEQIEVLKGPQGSLYGRNAIGGALNITTQQPGNVLEGRLRAGYAQGNAWTVDGRISGPIVEDKVLFDVSAGYSDSDGLLRNTFLDEKVDFERVTTLRGKLKFMPTDTLEIDLRGSFEDRKGGVAYFVNFPSADPNNTDIDIKGGALGIGTRKLYDASAKVTLTTDTVSLTSVTAYARVKDDFYEDLDFDPPAFLDAEQFVRVESISQELRLASEGSGAFQWLLGGYVAQIDQDASTFVLISPCYLVDPSTCPTGPVVNGIRSPFGMNENRNRTFALFGQADAELTSTLKATVGLRYDRDNRSQYAVDEDVTRKKTFSALQPKLSLSYQPADSQMYYATISRGFRSGAFNGTDYVTRMYEAESLWNYELGAKLRTSDGLLTLNAAAFYMDYKDRQEYVLRPGTGAQTLFNIPKSRIYGFEIDGRLRPTRDFTIEFGLGALNSKIERTTPETFDAFGQTFVGNDLPRVPTLTTTAAATYSAELTPDVTLTARGDWTMWKGVHWSLGNINDRQNSVNLFNARLSLDYQKQIRFDVYATNLFDKTYYTEVVIPGFGAISPMPAGFFAKPRQVGASVSYSF